MLLHCNGSKIRYEKSMGSSVLVVHGDSHIRRFTATILRSGGYEVRVLASFALPDAGSPDVLLIPWNVATPFDRWLAGIRDHAATASSRIVVMAPREELGAAAEVLDGGADDCIGIPFAPAELLARIKACLRRPGASERPTELRAGPVVLDVVMHRVRIDGRAIELAPTEFRLMAFLLDNPGRVFSREELLRRAWTQNIKAGVRTVDVHVRRLRQQLEPFGCQRMIQTVRGFGYRFAAEPLGLERRAKGSPLVNAGGH